MRHQYFAPLIALGLVACQATTPPRPATTTGGEDGAVPSGTATSKPAQATATPAPTATPTAGPITPDTSSPWSISSSASTSTSAGSAGGAKAGGSAGAQLPRRVARHGFRHANRTVMIAGGLLEPAAIGARGEFLNTFATASVTASGSFSVIGAWSSAALPLRICDQGLTADHKNRFVMIGGVTLPDNPTSSDTPKDVKDVYLGTPDSAGKVSWAKQADLPQSRAAFGLATSSDGVKHYVVGGSPGASTTVFIGTSADSGSITWTTSSAALKVGVIGAAAVIASSKLYVIGGATLDDPSKAVYASAIDSSGNLGEFAKVADLPAARSHIKAYVDGKGQIVVVGGNGTKDTESGTTSTVFIGKFDSGGALTFSTGPAFPLPIQHYGLALTGIDAIIAGGSHVGEVSQYSDKVYQLPLTY